MLFFPEVAILIIDCCGEAALEERSMRALLYADTFPRLVRDWREDPGKWLSRLVFLLGPWVCLWMVEL